MQTWSLWCLVTSLWCQLRPWIAFDAFTIIYYKKWETVLSCKGIQLQSDINIGVDLRKRLLSPYHSIYIIEKILCWPSSWIELMNAIEYSSIYGDINILVIYLVPISALSVFPLEMIVRDSYASIVCLLLRIIIWCKYIVWTLIYRIRLYIHSVRCVVSHVGWKNVLVYKWVACGKCVSW